MFKKLRELKAARPVVHLDRRRKAQMIEAIVADHLRGEVSGLRILDIGCGNGDISEHFAERNVVSSVDVCDRRRNRNATFRFQLVDSEHLPFDDAVFDAVLSHHVIEHVSDQGLHLDEMRRVLAPRGICYLATPNRTSPLMKGHVGNPKVLRYGQMHRLFEAHRFAVHEYGVEVVKRPRDFHRELEFTRWIPRPVAAMLRYWYPSQMFVLVPFG